MTEAELTNIITNHIIEAFVTLREYDSQCDSLEMSIEKNSVGSYYIKAHNDAYKKNVKPLLVNKFVDDAALRFREANKNTPDEELFCLDAVLYAFDKASKEVIEGIGGSADERQKEMTRLILSAMKTCLHTQLYFDGRKQK